MKIKRLLAILLTLMLVIPGGLAESPAQTEGDIAEVSVDLPEALTEGGAEIVAVPAEAEAQQDDDVIIAACADSEVPEAGELSLEDLGEDLADDLGDAPADSGPEEAPEPPADEDEEGGVTYRFIAGEELYAAQHAREGEEVACPEPPAAPEGMAFAGWALEDGTPVFIDGAPLIAHADPLITEINVLAVFIEVQTDAAESSVGTPLGASADAAADAEGESTEDKTDAEQDATEADEPAKASLSEGGGAIAPEGVHSEEDDADAPEKVSDDGEQDTDTPADTPEKVSDDGEQDADTPADAPETVSDDAAEDADTPADAAEKVSDDTKDDTESPADVPEKVSDDTEQDTESSVGTPHGASADPAADADPADDADPAADADPADNADPADDTYGEPFSQSALCDGVIVTVRADAGTFPAGAMLSVTKVMLDEQGLAEAAVDEVRAEDQNVAARYTFDIRVLDAEGVELQPAEGRTVQVSFAMAEVADENLETNVYHIADDMTAERLDVTAVDADTAVVETEGFSLYTVEFTYNTLLYVLEGGASVALAEILEEVGLTGEVEAVAVSDASLFDAVLRDGAWVVESYRAFDSEEWMKVTINAQAYEITVTDATGSVEYVDENGEDQTQNNVNFVQSNSTSWSTGWYAVTETTGINSRVTVTGNVNLILCDGKMLTAEKGITVNRYSRLTVWAQTNGTGALYAGTTNGYDYTCNVNCAGIGGGDYGAGGYITVNGGTVTAKGGEGGAGIGGGTGGAGGTVKINGGTVEAEGGTNGAGIGGGFYGAGGTVEITGGEVTATGGENAAGIGAGSKRSGGTLRLDLSGAADGDYLKADSYNCAVNVADADDRPVYVKDGSRIYYGAISDTSVLNGKTLVNYVLPQPDILLSPVDYLDESGATQTCEKYTPVGAGMTTWGTAGETTWYAVTENATLDDRVTVTGDVNLILCDGATLTAKAGIAVSGSIRLTVWAQTNGTGALYAGTTDGYDDTCNVDCAGIGGGKGMGGGTINITGGTVKANGSSYGAGIGGGKGGYGSTVNITGGTVEARGGIYGAGIGGGAYRVGGTVNITGGKVTATGERYGAGIGGGQNGSGGTVNITGGTVTAIGNYGAGIGGGSSGSGGTVNITGGTVEAKSYDGKAIGAGYDGSSNGSLTLGDVKVYNSNTATTPVASGDRVTTCQETGYAKVAECDQHQYTSYTVLSDAQHKVACDWCSHEVEEAHSFTGTGGACACGGVEVRYIHGGKMQFCLPVTGDMRGDGASGGWYAVTTGTTLENRVTVTGDVNLILCAYTTLTAEEGITVSEGNSLTIWVHDHSVLCAGMTDNGENCCQQNCAGIGGIDEDGKRNAGTITVNGSTVAGIGGTVNAIGGVYGAGIGGGYRGAGGTITITGTVYVTATGGSDGAGIGGGYGGDGGNITITGGTVTANGIGGGGYGGGNGDGGGMLRLDFSGATDGSLRAYKYNCAVNVADANGRPVYVKDGSNIYSGAISEPRVMNDRTLVYCAPPEPDSLLWVEYLDENGATQTCVNYTPINAGTATWGTAGETAWYAVTENATLDSRVTVTGDVNLILCDDKTLTATEGITVSDGDSLTVWAQSGGTGTLYAGTTDGSNITCPNYSAGIGGTNDYGKRSAGTVTINGGNVTAAGGDDGYTGGAGIGGASNGDGGTVNITGGTVTATGGLQAAGIGGGWSASGGVITISGGMVRATSGYQAAGIGDGNGNLGDGGNITITGGKVEAKIVENGVGMGIGASDQAYDGTLRLDLSGAADGDYLKADSYNCDVNIADEDYSPVCVTDEDGNIYSGEISDTSVLNGKTLRNSRPEPVGYLDETGTAQTREDYIPVINQTTWGAAGKTTWYAVKDAATISDRVTVSGDVNLILCDGKTWTAEKGITVSEGNSLTLWAQTGGTGALYAGTTDGNNKTCQENCAGIGGIDADGKRNAGAITINGGTVKATGGVEGGAGIGGGVQGAGGAITVTGGRVEASGGAGIGAGDGGSGGTLRLDLSGAADGDYLKADSYNCAVTVADASGNDVYVTDGNRFYVGTLTDSDKRFAADKALKKGAPTPWQKLRTAIDKAGMTPTEIKVSDFADGNGSVIAGDGDAALLIDLGQDITLDLDGCTIDRALTANKTDGNVITVNGALTLKDSAGGGCITGGNNTADGGGVIVYGAFTLNGGTITGNRSNCGGGVFAAPGSAFTLPGGTIAGNTAVANGGGVFVAGAVFDMTGGSIGNNLAQDDSGGGVFAAEGSAFRMTGGAITGNAAGSGGGGVFVFGLEDSGGAFTLSGGAITGNRAGSGGGVYVDGDARFALSGAPEISGNTRDGSGPDNVYLYRDSVITVAGRLNCATPIGVTTLAKPGPEDGFVTLTDGLKDRGDLSAFRSDNDDFILGWSDDGSEAVLGLAMALSVTGYEGAYDGAAHGIRVMVTAPDSGYAVKYGTAEGQYTLDENPMYADVGEHTVYYRVTAKGYCTETGSATVKIAEAAVTVVADSRSKVEGEADPALTYTVTGLIGDDRLTGSLSRAAGEIPGTYEINRGTLSSDKYAILFTGAALTIKSKPEIIIPGDITMLPTVMTAGPDFLTVGWTPLSGAEGYDIFFTPCGKRSVYQLVETVPAGASNSCKITGLKTGVPYKSYIMAWRIENGVKAYIGKASPTVHAIAGEENARCCNAKSVTVRRKNLTVKVGRRRRIIGGVRGVRKGKKVLRHASRLRYYSSDRRVATVDRKGRVKGIAPGSCVVYVVANNGVYSEVTVTVKQ